MKKCPECRCSEVIQIDDMYVCTACKVICNNSVVYSKKCIEELKDLSKNVEDIEAVKLILKDNTIDFNKRKELLAIFETDDDKEKKRIKHFMKLKFRELLDATNDYMQSREQEKTEHDKEAKEFFSSIGGIDLKETLNMQEFIPAIGREKEIRNIAQSLLKEEKASIMITGKSGTGLTNLLHTIAYQIATMNLTGLNNHSVIELPTAFINDKSTTGEMERKLNELVEHARSARIILVLDSAETLVGQGHHRGSSVDLVQMLTPYLSFMKILFATTHDQFQHAFASNSSFISKINHIKLDELSEEYTIEILESKAARILNEDMVQFSSESIKDLVGLSKKNQTRAMPDKCIYLMDKVVTELSDSGYGEVKQVEKSDILKAIKDQTGIRFLEDAEFKKTLCSLPVNIKMHVYGQESAIDSIASELMMREFKCSEKANLPSVFYCTGPTGVGKTFFAKVLARILLGDDKKMYRQDMAELSDFTKVDKLLGKSGWTEKNTPFVNFVLNNPGGIILLDEFEKCDKAIKDLFLSVFSEGELKDGNGVTLYFNNMIIILTSNVIIERQTSIGFSSNSYDTNIQEELAGIIAPELVNRLDAVIFFDPLDREACFRIVKKLATETVTNFQNQGVDVSFDDKIINYVVENGYSIKFNARELERTFNRLVLNKIVKKFFKDNESIKHWKITIRNGKVAILNSKKKT